MASAADILELVPFLGDAKIEVRRIAIQHIMTFCDSVEGREALWNDRSNLLQLLVLRLSDNLVIAHDAIRALINLSADAGADGDSPWACCMVEAGLVVRLMDVILDKESKLSPLAAMLLSNCTRSLAAAARVLELEAGELVGRHLQQIVPAFCGERGFSLDGLAWLGTVFSNITQLPQGRDFFLRRHGFLLKKILPFTTHENVIRRGGVVGTLRNCAFARESLAMLASPVEVHALPWLMLPLMDGRVYEQDEQIGMPLEVRDLSVLKLRESDPAIRKMLVETLYMLCADDAARAEVLKARVYPVIRDAHRAEDDPEVDDTMSKIVDVLLPELYPDDGASAAAADPLDPLGLNDPAAVAEQRTYRVGRESDSDA